MSGREHDCQAQVPWSSSAVDGTDSAAKAVQVTCQALHTHEHRCHFHGTTLWPRKLISSWGVSQTVLLVLLAAAGLPWANAARHLVSGSSTDNNRQAVVSPEEDPLGIALLEYESWLDGQQHLPCMDYFVRRTQATSCRILPSPSGWRGPPVAAELCNMPGGDVLVSIFTSLDLRGVFHAHLVGPQVAVLPVSTCAIAMRAEGDGNLSSSSGLADARVVQESSHGSNRRRAAAHQLLVTDVMPGDYTLTLRMMYFNFSFSLERKAMAASACGEPLWSIPLTINGPASGECTYCGSQPSSWPVCSSAYVHGAVMLGKHHHSHEVPAAAGADPAAWKPVLRYQPKGCNFVPRAEIDTDKCLQDRLVCFVGDSHSRHAQNGFIDALSHQGINTVDNTPIHTMYYHPKVRFVWEKFGDLGAVQAEGKLDGCTDVIMGIGAWVLANKAPRWTAGHYAFALNKAFKVAQQQNAWRFHFITMPHHRHTCLDSQESRTPPFTTLFNAIAVQTAQSHGISVINTIDITAPLYQTAHDSVHHHHVGFVGTTITEYILNVLCVQNQ